MALQVLGNPPTAGGRIHWLGQTLADLGQLAGAPFTFQGSCVRTQAQAQAAMQATQATIGRGETLLREAEEKRELLRPFHRRHKIESARHHAWGAVYARLEVEGWSEALSEARTSLAAARRAHAQHPGRAARVRALALAEAAVAEMVAGEQTAQSNYHRMLANDALGRSLRVLQKAGVNIAGVNIAADTTAEVAGRACLAARDAEVEALRALTRMSEEVSKEVYAEVSAVVPLRAGSNGDIFYWSCKGSVKSFRKLLGERRRAPSPRLPLPPPAPCTRVRASPPPARGELSTCCSRHIAGDLALIELTERHFARTEVRSSLGLPPLAPPYPSPSPNPNPNQARASLGLPPLAPPYPSPNLTLT